MQRIKLLLILLFSVFLLTSCSIEEILDDVLGDDSTENNLENSGHVTPLVELQGTEAFKDGALEHILEGELNRKGNAVGFHYDGLPTKKGKVISGTETDPNEHGVYEAKVEVSDVAKTSNSGKSSFFPKEWDSQDVVDAINEAYENSTLITGNTYEGLSNEGQVIRMYLDHNEKIISAFPVY